MPNLDSPNSASLDRFTFATRRVDKPWGYEIIWAESEQYVGKILFVRAGQALSLQFHTVKDETVYVHEGKVQWDLRQMPTSHLLLYLNSVGAGAP